MGKERSRLIQLGCFVLCIGTIFAYLPALTGEFLWDDDVHVSENRALRSLHGLWLIWTQLGATPQYYPLTHTSFWIQYQIFGPIPAAYHVGNLLLHIGSSLMVWWILRRLAVPGAFLAALLFAWHPVHVESVAWISERKNTLSGFFYLLAGACAIRAFRLDEPVTAPSPRPEGRWYAGMLISALAAVLSKTITSTLPAAIVLIAWWKRRRIDWSVVLWLAPLWILAAIFGRITAGMERDIVGATGPEWQLNFAERVLIAGRAIAFYASKLAAPLELTFIYPRWQIDAGSIVQWSFPAGVIVAVVTLWALRRRIGYGPVTGVLFFIGTLFPALGFVNVYPMRFSFVADHFQYLASIGLLALVAGGLLRATGTARATPLRITPGVIVCGLLAVVLAALTFRQAHLYQSPEILWTDVLAKSPRSLIARDQLATIRLREGDIAQAAEMHRQSLEIDPQHVEALIGLSSIALRHGDRNQALALAQQGVDARPNRILTRLHLARTLEPTQPDAAMAEYRRILDQDERFEPAHLALARLLALQGRLDDAIAECQRAIELYPRGIQSRVLLGDLHLNQGNLPQARAAYQAALEIEPGNPVLQQRMRVELVPRP